METALHHRGPNASGTWFDSSHRVALVHTRLAVIDLSAQANQPMKVDPLVLSYNGELYNFKELKHSLEQMGESFFTHSDTEVVAVSIRRWGIKRAVSQFVGMFAFAIWDTHSHTLHLVRDRVGIKPLYLGQVGTSYVFSSELTAINALKGFSKRINSDGFRQYLEYGYVPSPNSIYEGIKKVRPGTIVSIPMDGEPQEHVYWSAYDVMRDKQNQRLHPPEFPTAQKVLSDLLSNTVRDTLVSDVPVGAFLSGGIDSSLTLSYMQEHSKKPVKTFTVCFDDNPDDEGPGAALVAKLLGTDHHEIHLSERGLGEELPNVICKLDEPIADSSFIPTYLISRHSRSLVTVALTGDGGDELFGGYTWYRQSHRIWSMLRWIPECVRSTLGHHLRSPFLSHLFTKYGVHDPATTLTPNSNGISSEWVRKFSRILSSHSPWELYCALKAPMANPAKYLNNGGSSNHAPIPLRPKLLNDTEAFMLNDFNTFLPDDVLTKVDRASMAVGLEIRVPLLDHRVVEEAFSLPVAYKFRKGLTKALLKELVALRISPQIAYRPKQGFTVPLARWLNGSLRAWAESIILSESLERSGLWNVTELRRSWQELTSGKRGSHHAMWTILSFEAWKSRTGATFH